MAQVEVLGAVEDALDDQWFSAHVLGSSCDLVQVVYKAVITLVILCPALSSFCYKAKAVLEAL